MKFLKFIIQALISYTVARQITSQYFNPENWSFLFANFAVQIIVYKVARWAFERKVADLYYKDEKVGTMRDE